MATSTSDNSCGTDNTVADTSSTVSDTSNKKEMTGTGLTPSVQVVLNPTEQNCTIENSTASLEVPVPSSETDKKTNTKFQEKIYMYPDFKENIKGPTVPQQSIEDRFICKPVSVDESTLKQKEQSPMYGIECVQIFDEMAFDDDDDDD